MRRFLVHSVLMATIVLSGVLQAKERGGSDSGSPRVISLAIAPARLDAGRQSPSLFLAAEERTDGDGAAFYAKAAQAVPGSIDSKQLSEWTKLPLYDLPQDEVRAVLDQASEALDLVGQGARRQNCNWPPFVPGIMPPNLSEYRQLTFLLCVQARLQIAQRHHDQAIETIRTGLAMSKHIGECPTAAQGMVGVAMAALLLRPIQDLVQTQGAPNLFAALQTLPRPLVDLEVSLSSELKNLESSTQYNALVRGTMRRHLEDSHKRIRVLMHRLDSEAAALQCVEALRHYAAGHDGRLPDRLGEITDIRVPDDPSSRKPFAYQLERGRAILEVEAPKDGTTRDVARYEITVAR